MPQVSTQSFLQFEFVREGAIVLRGGGLRAILMVSGSNFGLKSQEEQEATVYAFQNFLNSLDFDIQITIHSRKIDIEPYLATLGERLERAETDLLRVQTREYIEFIRSFVEGANIMAKQFFVIVPYDPVTSTKERGVVAKARALLPVSKKETVLEEENFETNRKQLMERVEFTVQGLHKTGLRSTALSTEEIIELLWKLYNPEKEAKGQMPNFEELGAASD